jgi:uncharacterized YigZ family protein
VSRPHRFHVASGSAEAEHRVKGSRFLAVTHPASDLESALRFRETERRRFHDATHHVYATVLRNGESRFDDDGEPSGTGGRPVLSAIERAGFVDIVVVVTRYFGGTKLGTGGLGRAYGVAADLALERTPARSAIRACRAVVSYDYPDTGWVAHCVESVGGVRLRETYGERAKLEVALPASEIQTFRRQVAEGTADRARVTELPGESLLACET